MAFIGWPAFQLITALSVLAAGVVLGHIWEARMNTRSKNRISGRVRTECRGSALGGPHRWRQMLHSGFETRAVSA
jgi:hypothetical protein